MRKKNGPTEAQFTMHLIQQGILAGCAVVTLLTAARAAVKVKETTDDAKDFIRGAKSAL